MRVAVASGKWGTGKTSLVSAFARLSSTPLVLADCDVDAANLALTLSGADTIVEPFFAGRKAVVDPMSASSARSPSVSTPPQSARSFAKGAARAGGCVGPAPFRSIQCRAYRPDRLR